MLEHMNWRRLWQTLPLHCLLFLLLFWLETGSRVAAELPVSQCYQWGLQIRSDLLPSGFVVSLLNKHCQQREEKPVSCLCLMSVMLTEDYQPAAGTQSVYVRECCCSQRAALLAVRAARLQRPAGTSREQQLSQPPHHTHTHTHTLFVFRKSFFRLCPFREEHISALHPSTLLSSSIPPSCGLFVLVSVVMVTSPTFLKQQNGLWSSTLLLV